jgi:hypothetical protein
MVLTKEAEEAKPKRPQTIYMYWRVKKLAEIKDEEGKNDVLKKQWKEITEEEKSKIKK